MKSLPLLFVVGCSSPPPHTLVTTPATVESAAPTGSLIWVKPVNFEYTGEAPPLPTGIHDPANYDQLMVFDFATGTSRDLQDALTLSPGVVTPSGDVAYVLDRATRQRMSKHPDGWHVDNLDGLASTDDIVAAIAPDESSLVTFGHDGLCLVMRDTQECTRIELPFDGRSTVTYTSGGRVVVTSATGKYDATAVGLGQHVAVAVLDLATKILSRLDITAIDAIASTDGRLAWVDQAAGKLVLSVARLDHLKAKQTFTLGPAAQADADCAFAGERILCVVEPASALVSLARNATMVTLESAKVVSRGFPSPDGRWVLYARDDDRGKASWLVTPTDRRAPQPLPLDASAEPSAWLR